MTAAICRPRTACGDQTVYDAIYLSLALSLRSQVITADSRFRNRLEASPYVRWVGDLS